MRVPLVVTFSGIDRAGIVDAMADAVVRHRGNWESSRLVSLAGRFAGVFVATVEAAQSDALVHDLNRLSNEQLRIWVDPGAAQHTAPPSETRLRLQLTGADHQGIVHDISHVLAARGISIDEIQTELTDAPMAGGDLFTATAFFRPPRGSSIDELRRALEKLADDLVVELSLAETER